MSLLRKPNGWQRLWLSLTALFLIIASVATFADQQKYYDYGYRAAADADYKNPQCARFINGPYDRLQEPPFADDGGTCWYIFTSREFAPEHRAFAAYDAWAANYDHEFWSRVELACAIVAALVLVASGVVYALGRTIGWIAAGFRAAEGTSGGRR